MAITIRSDNYRALISSIIPVIALIFLFTVFSFSCFYLISGYDHLVTWYTGLNDCFYKKASWANDFFTPRLKAAGNLYCIIAILITLAGIVYVFRHVRNINGRVQKEQHLQTKTFQETYDLILIGVSLVIMTLSWFWGRSVAAASNDEVFSAVNCAGIHPFQTVSYYMLPNNHIFFNLLNNVIFHPVSNKVSSGRFISLACYWGLIILFFLWMKHLLRNRWFAFLATLTMAMQFPIWCFGFQARGYEFLALCEWVAFISLFQYLIAPQRKWLYLLLIACVLGYFCVPSFLFFHFAILSFAITHQAISRKADLLFWKYQTISVLVVYLLYLPCLCFSGPGAITGNAYVVLNQNYDQLVADIIPMFKNYMDYCFSNFITGYYQFDLVLFLLPLCLLFYKKNRVAFLFGLYYLALWGVCILLTVIMKVYPIDRALTGQFSITLALVIYTVCLLVNSLSKRVSAYFLQWVLIPLFLVLLSVNYVKKSKQYAAHYQCHFPVNMWHDLVLNEGLSVIPKGSSVSFSNESFYWYYLCKEYGYRVNKCTAGNEDYFVKLNSEPFTEEMSAHYLIVKNVGDYVICRRK